MKTFIQEKSRMLPTDPRSSLQSNSKLLYDLASNLNPITNPITNPIVSPVLDTIVPRNAFNDNANFHPAISVDSNKNQNIIQLELERLKRIDLTYLSLFRKNSRFSNKGFTHFFLSQELNINDDSNLINNNNIDSESLNSSNKDGSSNFSNNHEELDLKSNLSQDFDKLLNNANSSIADSHAIYNLSFSHDGKFLASSGADGLIKVWEVITSEMDRHDNNNLLENNSNTTNNNNNPNINGNVLNLPVKPHRKSFIDAAIDETITDITSLIKPMTPSSNDLKPRKDTITSHDSNLSGSNYTADDSFIYRNTNKIKPSIYAPVFKSKPTKTFYHDKTINSIDWSKNNFILSSSEDGTAKLWHADRADCLQTYKFDSIVTCAKFHKADDRFFIASQWNGRIVFISILEKQILYEINLNKLITCLEFSPDSKKIFVGCDKGYIYTLAINDDGFKIESHYQIKRKNSTPSVTGLKVLVDNVSNCASPSSSNNENSVKIIISTNDSKIRLVNYDGRFLEVKYSGHINKSSSIYATSNEDNTYVISGSEDGWTYIWQIYSDKKNKIENEKKLVNKAHFDILKFFKDDTCIIENKYYGSFHTNNTRCNISIFAPRASLKLLELSSDPIFDLKHQYSFALKESHIKDLEIDDLSTAIIVTADNSGKIKVFRRDFSHYIRKALQGKKISQLIEKRKQTMSNSMSQKVLNRNSLIIPNYEATSMNIADTMASVYSDADGNFRGRQDNKGIIKPANKFAVESSIVPVNQPNSLPTINIHRVTDSKTNNIDNNLNQSSKVLNNSSLKNKSKNSKIINDSDFDDSESLNSIQISDSVKNIDDELKQLLLTTPKANDLHDVKQNQHSTTASSSINHVDTGATVFTCSRCHNTDFSTRPMDSGDTNQIRFFCNKCGKEATM
jgi:WD40 repeat protein